MSIVIFINLWLFPAKKSNPTAMHSSDADFDPLFKAWTTWLGNLVKVHCSLLTCPTWNILVCVMYPWKTTSVHALDADLQLYLIADREKIWNRKFCHFGHLSKTISNVCNFIWTIAQLSNKVHNDSKYDRGLTVINRQCSIMTVILAGCGCFLWVFYVCQSMFVT